MQHKMNDNCFQQNQCTVIVLAVFGSLKIFSENQIFEQDLQL